MINLGVIGKPSPWLISSQDVDYNLVREKFKINLIDIEMNELLDLFHKHLKDLPDNEYLAYFGNRKSVELNRTYALYLALWDLIYKYKLKGVTCRCYDTLEKDNVACCVPFSILNTKKIVACCESNIPLFISMYLVKKYIHTTSFVGIVNYLINEEHEVIMSHCTVPLNMCENFKLKTHFETEKSLAIAGQLYTNKRVDIFRLSNDFSSFVLLKGNIKTNFLFTKMCRTQIGIILDKDIDMSYFLKRPLGNHHLVFYTKDEDKIIRKIKKYHLKQIK